jgi:hypothetical protein
MLHARMTVPAKPLRLTSFNVEAFESPCAMVRVVGLAERLKSVMFRVMPLVQVVVPELLRTWGVLEEAEQLMDGLNFSIEEAVPPASSGTREGVKLSATHPGTPLGIDSATIPVYPFWLCSNTVVAPVPPMGMVNVNGEIVGKKLLTAIVTGTECEEEPLVPLTVTV